MDYDPYAKNLPNHSYIIRSLYYDSAGLDSYYQKIAGVRTRKKLRIRFYEPDLKPQTPVFLEIKRKYDTVVVKDRLVLSYVECCNLLKDNRKLSRQFDEGQKATLDEFLWLKHYNGMIPQAMVIYKECLSFPKLTQIFG